MRDVETEADLLALNWLAKEAHAWGIKAYQGPTRWHVISETDSEQYNHVSSVTLAEAFDRLCLQLLDQAWTVAPIRLEDSMGRGLKAVAT